MISCLYTDSRGHDTLFEDHNPYLLQDFKVLRHVMGGIALHFKCKDVISCGLGRGSACYSMEPSEILRLLSVQRVAMGTVIRSASVLTETRDEDKSKGTPSSQGWPSAQMIASLPLAVAVPSPT